MEEHQIQISGGYTPAKIELEEINLKVSHDYDTTVNNKIAALAAVLQACVDITKTDAAKALLNGDDKFRELFNNVIKTLNGHI